MDFVVWAVIGLPYAYIATRVIAIAWHTEKLNYQRNFIRNLEKGG